MAAFGSMVCGGCGHHGPQLMSGAGMNFVSELRRCGRCSGLNDVLVAVRDAATGRWKDWSPREPRCRNQLPWPRQVAPDSGGALLGGPLPPEDAGGPRVCRSRRLTPIVEGMGDDDLVQPCPACGGEMRFEMSAIAD